MSNATPQAELSALITDLRESLTRAEKLAYSIPEASSVRPTISQAKAAFSQVGFSAEVGNL